MEFTTKADTSIKNLYYDEKIYTLITNDHPVELDSFEKAAGPERVSQYALESFMNDAKNSMNDRRYALAIYIWLGSSEASIDELVPLAPCASQFIFECLKKYRTNCPPNILLYFIEAVDSLAYQLAQQSTYYAWEYLRNKDV